jgi:hypothetical protein
MQSQPWVYGRSRAGILSSNPVGGMDVCSCECCVLSGRSLLHRADHPSRGFLWECRVSECDRETLIVRRPCPLRGCYATAGGGVKILIMLYSTYNRRVKEGSIQASRCIVLQ